MMRLNSSMMDSGLVVVVFIISSLIIITFSFLLLVDYEWCQVLYKNNTVSYITIDKTRTACKLNSSEFVFIFVVRA